MESLEAFGTDNTEDNSENKSSGDTQIIHSDMVADFSESLALIEEFISVQTELEEYIKRTNFLSIEDKTSLSSIYYRSSSC
jgi:hypothetical protein